MSEISVRSSNPRTGSAIRIPWIRLAPWLYTIGLFIAWELAVRASGLPHTILPTPTRVFEAIVQYWSPIWKNSLQTLYTTTVGFIIAVIAGLGIGLFIGWSKTIYAGLYPLMIGFNAIPKVALVPILMIWVGVGSLPAVITAFVISFFPIVVNVATGLATIEPEMRDVLRSLGATQTEILTKVGIPRAMPYLFASLKVAITLAFIGSVISETVGGNNGIGFLMLSASARNDAPTTFAGLFAIAIMGVVMYAICALVEKRMTRWAFRGELVS
jgi:NitT/TauT family transport system permease protein